MRTGRNLHGRHRVQNIDYVPADLVGTKVVETYLYSPRLDLAGRVDEAVDTGSQIVLLERKYTDRVVLGDTIKVQLGLLSLLVEENLRKPVNIARVIFQKTERTTLEVDIDSDIRAFALQMLEETKHVVTYSEEPEEHADNRCLDCCFRRICPIPVRDGVALIE